MTRKNFIFLSALVCLVIILTSQAQANPDSVNVVALERIKTEKFSPYLNKQHNYIRSLRDSSSLIREINSSGYINMNNEKITEEFIYNLSADNYGKSGLTADGNTRLFLRAQSDRAGTFKFSIPEGFGTLEDLNRRGGGSEIEISTTNLGNGIYQASAVLISPADYPVSNTILFPSHAFDVNLTFTDNNGISENVPSLNLKIQAVPVVLIHGIFGEFSSTFNTGGAGVWNSLYNAYGGGYPQVSGWNYTNIHGPIDAIPDNSRSELFYHIAGVLDAINYKYNIACTRVDLVVHSMGGLMARRFLQADSGQKNSALAYKQGLIRRIITIATPHEGSPIANYALYGTTPLAPDTIMDLLNPDYLLAKGVLALAKSNSDLINSLNSRSSVPIHVICGRVRDNIDSVQIFDMPKYFSMILRYAPSLFSVPSSLFRIIFGDDDYDIAVGMSSAVSNFSKSTEKNGLNYNHVSICEQNDIGELIVQLLQGPSSNFDTSGVGVSSAYTLSRPLTNIAPAEISEFDEDIFTQGFNLTVNDQDDSITANQLQTVNFTAKIDEEINNDVYLFIDGDSDTKIMKLNDEGDKKTFSASLIIPENFTGIYELSCVSSADNGKIYTSNTVKLIINPDLEIQVRILCCLFLRRQPTEECIILRRL